MKGLELCTRFFFDKGLPLIKREMPACLSYLAAGIPAGSQCSENDDETSMDHGWGPGFVIWLDQKNYARFGASLQTLLDTLPDQYLGYSWTLQPRHTCSVVEIGAYIRHLVGYSELPPTERDWLYIPEFALFEVTHRPILMDALGEITSRFRMFRDYPLNIWKKRLSAALAWLWRWGIEYLPRAEAHKDEISAAMYWSRFAESAMKTTFLLNKRYAPYHKWLYREFLKLPILASQMNPWIIQGFEQQYDRSKTAAQILAMCIQEVTGLGFKPFKDIQEQPHIHVQDQALYNLARGVQETIIDEEIRRLDIYLEVCLPATRTLA